MTLPVISPLVSPVISIVTISFNQAKYLAAAIESVLGQDYPALDYIIVDPGSTDGSRDIIEAFRSRLGAVLLDPDQGPADGLNKGFTAARGNIFGYINADDLLLPGALVKVARRFAERPVADVLCGNGMMIDAAGRTIRPIATSRFSLTAFGHGAMTFVQQGNFFRREAFAAAGGFNAANRTCWDAELLIDMARAGARVVNVPDRLGAFRLYGDTITGSGRLAAQTRIDFARLAEKALGRPPRRSDAIVRPARLLARRLTHPKGAMTGLAARLRARRLDG